MKNSTKRTQNEGTLSALLSATKGLFLLSSLTSLKFGCAHCNSSSKLDSCSLARTFCFPLTSVAKRALLHIYILKTRRKKKSK